MTEDNKGKKFDICLMNPPYYRGLHLKFLEKTIQVSENVVSVQLITWLQNSFGDMTGKKVIDKFNITDVEFLGKLSDSFPSTNRATYDIGIIHIDKNAKQNNDLMYNFIELYKGERINPGLIKSVKQKILDYCKSNNLEDNIKRGEIDENTNYCIVMPVLVGNPGIKVDKFFYRDSSRWGRIFHKGKSEGKTASEYKKKLSNVKNYTVFDYLEFDTEKEANNYIDFQETDFIRFITILNSVDSQRRCKFIPFMKDYSRKWTNDDLCNFFNITDSEKKEIHHYIDLYDKKFRNK